MCQIMFLKLNLLLKLKALLTEQALLLGTDMDSKRIGIEKNCVCVRERERLRLQLIGCVLGPGPVWYFF